MAACSSSASKIMPEPAPAAGATQTPGALTRPDLGERHREPDAGSPARNPLSDGGPVQSDDDLVDVATILPDLLLDMRYASKNNFVGEIIYPVARCLLRRKVARALARVQKQLQSAGYQLLLWDCYRPFAVQERFWQLMPDHRYVAKPVRKNGEPWRGSKHNRGAAVDLTLADARGTPLVMPTDHDDFSERAHRAALGAPPIARANAALLDQAMSAEGFEAIATEWWHFDYQGWRSYPLSDQGLAD